MTNPGPKPSIGVLGCGAIGSGIAFAVKSQLRHLCRLGGIYDIDLTKTRLLEKRLKTAGLTCRSFEELLSRNHFIIEAIVSSQTKSIIKRILTAKKNLLVMSVGQLLDARKIFDLAAANHCALLIPSGGIAGLDAIKAATNDSITRITLTTRKPPAPLADSDYLKKKRWDLTQLKKETVVFEGTVKAAVKAFPANINVAATLALAAGTSARVRIRIVADPHLKRNCHEINVAGAFGQISTSTENIPCPDNPKTSYLAVLSAIQTLKQFFSSVKIGT